MGMSLMSSGALLRRHGDFFELHRRVGAGFARGVCRDSGKQKRQRSTATQAPQRDAHVFQRSHCCIPYRLIRPRSIFLRIHTRTLIRLTTSHSRVTCTITVPRRMRYAPSLGGTRADPATCAC